MIELMITVLISICLFLLGSALGSFAAATVWRLRVRQLADDKKAGLTVEGSEKTQVKRLAMRSKTAALKDRSICLHCGRELRAYDLIPVVSWVSTRGKCRTCKKPIGKMEILAEVLVGASFVVSYLVWPYVFDTQGIVYFVIWCIMLVLLAVHWMYDARWFLLLDRITILITILALIFVSLRLADIPAPLLGGELLGLGITLAVLPGFYGLLYVISRGGWIGFGDVKLLVPFALMLPSWEYGVLLIFLANLIGCLVLLPAMVSKKLSRTSRVPFGPFLIAAFVITVLFGQNILDFYIGTVLF